MLCQCLNPNCGKPFRYLHEGRIFRIEQVRVAPGSTQLERSVESYWLCGTCSRRLKVIVENGCVLTSPIDATAIVGQQSHEMAPVL